MDYPKIRDITHGILERCGIQSPPVDLDRIVRHFTARVIESPNVAASAVLQDRQGWLIRVNSKMREERRSFRIAHEIGHIWWHDPEHHLGDPNLGGGLEQYCSKFASLLFCPHQWLIRDAPEADFDLFRLKALYTNMSHEALALRLCFLTTMVVTILDNGKIYRRFGTPQLAFSKKEQKIEHDLFESVDLYGVFRESKGELSWAGVKRRVRVRGYPVFSPEVRRVILFTTPAAMEYEDSAGLEEDMPYPFPDY